MGRFSSIAKHLTRLCCSAPQKGLLDIDSVVTDFYPNNEDDFQMKLDGVYYPLNDNIRLLTTCMEEMRQDIARMQTQRAAEATTPTSIGRNLSTSIDDALSPSNPMKSQPDSYTRAEIDQMVEEIFKTLGAAEERLDKIYDIYAILVRHQFELECLGDILQKIENATATMNDKWHRGDKAMRYFIGTKADLQPNCLGAWYTWDQILQTSLEGPDTCLGILASCDRYPQGKAYTFIYARIEGNLSEIKFERDNPQKDDPSPDPQTTTSSDGSTEESMDTLIPISINANLPEAGDEEEHVYLIGETGFRKQRLADQQRNMSFTRTYKAKQTHKGKLESMMGQVLKGQQKISAVLDVKLDYVYSELHDKFETLSDHVKKLDSEVAHNAGFVRRDEGFLPGRTDTNPRRQKNLDEDEKAKINLDEEEEESKEDVEIDRQEGNNVDRPTMINIDRQTGNNVDRYSIPAKPAVERVYRTLPHFLSTIRSSDLKASVSWLKDMVKGIRRLRLKQNKAEKSSTELDDSVSTNHLVELDRLAHSAGGLGARLGIDRNRSSWRPLGTGYGQLMAKGCKRENGTFSATTPTASPLGRFRLPLPINTRPWGQFWTHNSLGKPLPKSLDRGRQGLRRWIPDREKRRKTRRRRWRQEREHLRSVVYTARKRPKLAVDPIGLVAGFRTAYIHSLYLLYITFSSIYCVVFGLIRQGMMLAGSGTESLAFGRTVHDRDLTLLGRFDLTWIMVKLRNLEDSGHRKMCGVWDLTWIMVKLRNLEDSGHRKMCGVWVDSVRNELMIAYWYKAAGASGQEAADGAYPTQILPAQTGLVDNETGEPMVPIIPTEVQVDDVDNQQELRDEDGAESSHAGE
ncbi:hypothetical protein F2Q69_00022646 [Brassica cretica]|uniref:Uncharacterized protein n=1 Tax=Brassica cretica TaxID=69181 RepID=A0A8S9QGP4_BRACR|nr:hypothetical protein F2Q69_00022646 [Brassica cretica]